MPVNRYYSSIAVDTTLTAPVASGDSTITVANAYGFPQSFPFTLAIDYDTSSEELVDVTALVSGAGTTATLTVIRAVDSTAGGTAGGGIAHAYGAPVKHVISGRDMREAQEHMAASTNVHGIADTGVLVATTGVGNVSSGMLASGSVTTVKILDGNVTNAKLATDSVTSDKIAAGAVTSAKIANGAIVDADINASAAIDWTKLAISSTVSSDELNVLNGITSTTDELNKLHGVSYDASQINSGVSGGINAAYNAGTYTPTISSGWTTAFNTLKLKSFADMRGIHYVYNGTAQSGATEFSFTVPSYPSFNGGLTGMIRDTGTDTWQIAFAHRSVSGSNRLIVRNASGSATWFTTGRNYDIMISGMYG